MDIPCRELFNKFNLSTEFDVPCNIVKEILLEKHNYDNLKKILGANHEHIIKILSGANLKCKLNISNEKKVFKKLEYEFQFLNGKEKGAGELLLRNQFEKIRVLACVCEELCAAWRLANKSKNFTLGKKSFFEFILPAANLISGDPKFCRWTTFIIKIFQNPELFTSVKDLSMQRVFFDVETTGLLPDGRITCAVTQAGDDVRTWVSPGDTDQTYQLMTSEKANELVEYLYSFSQGKNVVTFNGAHFDFKMLNKHLEDDMMREKLIEIAKAHFDLHLACIDSAGHRMALNGLVLGTYGDKSKSGSGLDAIQWWKEKKYDFLFNYCAQDVALLKLLWEEAHGQKMLFYLPKKKYSTRKIVPLENTEKSAFEFNASIFHEY